MNILIIEDEEPAYRNLVKLIHEYDRSIQIAAWTTTAQSSVEWISAHSAPDLIFADVHLPDAPVFEVFRRTGIGIPVIFTTAYDQYAVEAFEVNSVDYLLKPIKFERLAKSIEKYKQLKRFPLNEDILEQLQHKIAQLSNAAREFKQRFLIRRGDRFSYIETGDIAFFFAEGNIVFVITKDKKKSVIDYSLDSLEKVLNPLDFFRVTRKYIVHISSIESVSRYFHSRLKVVIRPSPGEDIYISRVRVPAFLSWMEGTNSRK